jgi:uncharacterized protein (DUF427 family)
MWKFNGNHRPSIAIEPGAGQESVWDYPRPPICVDDTRRVIVEHGGILIANTTRAVRVLETASPPTVYVPPTDINFEMLERSAGSSFCEWKGAATYWSLHLNGHNIKNVGWSYENPSPAFAAIKSYLSFYPAKLECTLDGETVRPQPGGFYGGWLTDEIIGPYKGEHGTSGW